MQPCNFKSAVNLSELPHPIPDKKEWLNTLHSVLDGKVL